MARTYRGVTTLSSHDFVSRPAKSPAAMSAERELVKGALWVAAIELVPIEQRVEKVKEWLATVDHFDLWRVLRTPASPTTEATYPPSDPHTHRGSTARHPRTGSNPHPVEGSGAEAADDAAR